MGKDIRVHNKKIQNIDGINNLNSKINYLNQFERDRMDQAARLIKSFVDSNNVFKNLTINEQVTIYSYMVPLIEHMSIYIIIYIDYILNMKNIPNQRNLLIEYDKVANISYKINLEEYHQLLRFL